jgi:hypothetical protein
MEPWYLKRAQVDHHLKLNSIMHYMAGARQYCSSNGMEENKDRQLAPEHPRVLELLTRAHEHFTVFSDIDLIFHPRPFLSSSDVGMMYYVTSD